MLVDAQTRKRVGFVAEKVGLNFNVPKALRDAFYEVADPYGERKKWSVCSAAILMLLEASPERRDFYIAAAHQADFESRLEDLIQQARAGDLARSRPLDPPVVGSGKKSKK